MSIISLTDTKTYLQITTTASDTLLQLYIDLVESEIDAYTNRNLSQATYSEVVNYLENRKDANGYRPYEIEYEYPRLYLSEYPVTTASFALVFDNTTTVSSANYKLHADEGYLDMYSYQSDEKSKLVANYVAGYTTVSSPMDLRLVAFQGVKAYYENNAQAKQGGGDVKSKSLKDFSVSYGNTQSSLITQVGGVDGKVMKTYLAANDHILSKYAKVLI